MSKTTWVDKIMCFVVITYSLGFGENIMFVKECSSHQTSALTPMIVRLYSKSSKLGFSIM